MAVLTPAQLVELRQHCAEAQTVTWTKPQVNAALQAIEDRFEAVRASFGVAIETAAPGVFSPAQKVRLVKFWLRQKFGRE